MYGPGDACSGNWTVRSEVLHGLHGLQGALLSTGRERIKKETTITQKQPPSERR